MATVSSKGKITAKKKGTATITAKVSGKSYKCKVTVKNPYLNATKKNLEVNKTYTLKLTGATAKKYTSSKKSVATINSKGKITAVKEGTSTITVTDSNKKTYKCVITVAGKTTTHTNSYTAKITTPATCTKNGVKTYTCSGCGATGITEECLAGVWGYFDRGAAEELFSYVNSNRAVTQYGVVDAFGNPIGIETVPALTNFDGLYSTAKQRSAELATNYNHSGMKTDNENIGNGWENANACQQAWCYSSSHASTMTNNIYTQGSCAVFYYDADESGQSYCR